MVEKTKAGFVLEVDRPRPSARVRSFAASFGGDGPVVRLYPQPRPDGLKRAAETAVLNANYLMHRLKGTYHLPFDRVCKHECVFSDAAQLPHDVKTLDIAKRLMDYGFHPPTIYFPLIVAGALMIEPTETESKETLDQFVAAMQAIAREARETPDLVRSAPHKPVLSQAGRDAGRPAAGAAVEAEELSGRRGGGERGRGIEVRIRNEAGGIVRLLPIPMSPDPSDPLEGRMPGQGSTGM